MMSLFLQLIVYVVDILLVSGNLYSKELHSRDYNKKLEI